MPRKFSFLIALFKSNTTMFKVENQAEYFYKITFPVNQ